MEQRPSAGSPPAARSTPFPASPPLRQRPDIIPRAPEAFMEADSSARERWRTLSRIVDGHTAELKPLPVPRAQSCGREAPSGRGNSGEDRGVTWFSCIWHAPCFFSSSLFHCTGLDTILLRRVLD